MAQDTKISWAKHTANLWWGCTKVHEGCDFCYAETLSKRFGDDIWGVDKPRKQINSVWSDLDKFQRLAKEAQVIHRVFVGSMMDIFEKPMPLINSKGESTGLDTGVLRNKLFNFVIPASPNLMFLLLTKRPSNINKYIPESWKTNPPSNVMFGTSPVNQSTADTLIPQLLEVKGRKFLSIEPQLGPIRLKGIKYVGDVRKQIDWVINGGESGNSKRVFLCDWARELRDDCYGMVPYYFKQVDGVRMPPDDLLIKQFPR